MNTPIDEATPRKWRMSGNDTIIDGYDTICTIWPGGKVSQVKRGKQIVQAVNQYAALKAVAEDLIALKKMHDEQVFICGVDDEPQVQAIQKRINKHLSALQSAEKEGR